MYTAPLSLKMCLSHTQTASEVTWLASSTVDNRLHLAVAQTDKVVFVQLV